MMERGENAQGVIAIKDFKEAVNKVAKISRIETVQVVCCNNSSAVLHLVAWKTRWVSQPWKLERFVMLVRHQPERVRLTN